MLRLVTCLLYLKFIAIKCAENPRSVHVALETALTFNNKDSATNVKFIDDFQDFLSNVRKTVVRHNGGYRRFEDDDIKDIKEKYIASAYVSNLKFTDFIKELIEVLKNYSNEDLEDVISVIDDEIRKYHYKGCKFHELVSDRNLKRTIADNLDLVKEQSADEIKENLDKTLDFMENSKNDLEKMELMDYINSLYTKKDVTKFQKYLGYFHMYQRKSRRTNMDLVKLVRDTIRSIIFDHYSNLNLNTRRDFKAKIETYFWKTLREKDNMQHMEWTINYDGSHKEQHLRETTQIPKVVKENSQDNQPLQTMNIKNKKAPADTVDVDLKMNNQMDIIKIGSPTLTKKDKTPAIDETKSVKEKRIIPNYDSGGIIGENLNLENTENVEMNSADKSVTSSDELNILNLVVTMGHTYNDLANEDHGSDHETDNSSFETTKKKRYNLVLSHTTPFLIDASAEAVTHKKKNKLRYKYFTNANIGRIGNNEENLEIPDTTMRSNRFTSRPKKKKYQQYTTLHNKNRMQTLWKENPNPKKQDHYPTLDENSLFDMDAVVKDRTEHSKSKTRDYKKTHLNINSKLNKKKHKSKARDTIITKNKDNNFRTGETNNIKHPDFSINAYVDNIFPGDGQGLVLQLTGAKGKENKRSLRSQIKSDNEKDDNSEDDGDSSKHQNENSLPNNMLRGKLFDKFSDEGANEFVKQNKAKKQTDKNAQYVKKNTADKTGTNPDKDISETTIHKTTRSIPKKYAKTAISSSEQSNEENSKDLSREALETSAKSSRKEKSNNQKTKYIPPIAGKSNVNSLKKKEQAFSEHKKQKIFISLENIDHIPIKRVTRKKTTTKSLNKEIINSPTTKLKTKTVANNEGKKELLHQDTFNGRAILVKAKSDEYVPKEKINNGITVSSKTKKPDIKSDESVSEEKNNHVGKTKASSNTTPVPTWKTANPPISSELSSEEPTRNATIQTTLTTAKLYQGMDISINVAMKKDKQEDHSIEALLGNENKTFNETFDLSIEGYHTYFRRANIGDIKNATMALQLDDILKLYTTTRIYLDNITALSTVEPNNETTLKYLLSDFRRRPYNTAKKKIVQIENQTNIITTTNTTNSTLTTTFSILSSTNMSTNITTNTSNTIISALNTTTSTLSTNTTATITPNFANDLINEVPSDENIIESSQFITAGEKLKKVRKKKKKRRRTTTATFEAATKINTTNATTMINTTIATDTIPTTIPVTTKGNTPTITEITAVVGTPTVTEIATVANTTLPANRRHDIDTTMEPDTTESSSSKRNIDQNSIRSENNTLNSEDTTTVQGTQYENLDEYYNVNETLDYSDKVTDSDNTTMGIGQDLKEFMDKFSIETDATGTNDTNMEALSSIIGPSPQELGEKPDVKGELIEENAHRRVNKDMMKLFGKTLEQKTISTTPWNTLYTDALDDLNLLDVDIF